MEPSIELFKDRLSTISKALGAVLTERCQFLIDNFVKTQSEHNEDVYCFLINIYANSYQYELSINTETMWKNGYGATEDLDPAEFTLNGLRYSSIGYTMEPDCGSARDELSDIVSELYELSTSTDDDALRIALDKLMSDTMTVMEDVAVEVVNGLDLSLLNKTERFCAVVLNFERDWDDQIELVRRTVAKDVDELFPQIERREERTVDPDIISSPPVEQAMKLVEYIVHYHTDLDDYTASNNFDILMDAETRLIRLRPNSDAVIAETFDKLGPKVKTFAAGTAEYDEHGAYNKEFHILNALMDMAGASDEPLTPVLAKSLKGYLSFVKDNNNEYDANCLSTQVSFAMLLWNKENSDSSS